MALLQIISIHVEYNKHIHTHRHTRAHALTHTHTHTHTVRVRVYMCMGVSYKKYVDDEYKTKLRRLNIKREVNAMCFMRSFTSVHALYMS